MKALILFLLIGIPLSLAETGSDLVDAVSVVTLRNPKALSKPVPGVGLGVGGVGGQQNFNSDLYRRLLQQVYQKNKALGVPQVGGLPGVQGLQGLQGLQGAQGLHGAHGLRLPGLGAQRAGVALPPNVHFPRAGGLGGLGGLRLPVPGLGPQGVPGVGLPGSVHRLGQVGHPQLPVPGFGGVKFPQHIPPPSQLGGLGGHGGLGGLGSNPFGDLSGLPAFQLPLNTPPQDQLLGRGSGFPPPSDLSSLGSAGGFGRRERRFRVAGVPRFGSRPRSGGLFSGLGGGGGLGGGLGGGGGDRPRFGERFGSRFGGLFGGLGGGEGRSGGLRERFGGGRSGGQGRISLRDRLAFGRGLTGGGGGGGNPSLSDFTQ